MFSLENRHFDFHAGLHVVKMNREFRRLSRVAAVKSTEVKLKIWSKILCFNSYEYPRCEKAHESYVCSGDKLLRF